MALLLGNWNKCSSSNTLERYNSTLERLAELEKIAESRRQSADTLSREKDSIRNLLEEETQKRETEEKKHAQEMELLKQSHSEATSELEEQVIFEKLSWNIWQTKSQWIASTEP